MKNYIDLKTKEDIIEWLSEMKVLLKIPTQLPNVTAAYRDHLDWWDKLETWEKEELLENYQEELNQAAADSTIYGNFPVTSDELRNLSNEALEEFLSFVLVHVPSSVIEGRFVESDKRSVEKLTVKFQEMCRETRDRHEALKKIDRLGE